MDCSTFRKNHLDFVDDALSEERRSEMRAHAEACRPCSILDTRIRRALMVARNIPPVRPSAGFAEKLEMRLREVRAGVPDSSAMVARRVSRGPGIGEFLATAAGVVAAGLLLTAVMERGATRELPMLDPVVAMAPAISHLPLETPAFMASATPGVGIWPAALVLEQAPLHFVSDDHAPVVEVSR